MAAETREESQKLTSSTFGEEEGYCHTIWAKGVEETSAVGQSELSSVSNHTRENELASKGNYKSVTVGVCVRVTVRVTVRV